MAWEKGQSGNPGGRPKVVADVRRWAQGHTRKARKMLLSLMLTADKDATRLAAAKTILQLAGVSFVPEEVTEALKAAATHASPEAIRAVLQPPAKPLN